MKRGIVAGIAACAMVMGVFAAVAPTPADANPGQDRGASAGYIIVLEDGFAPGSVAAEHAQAHGAEVGHVYENVLGGYSAHLPEAAVAAIENDPRVRYVNEDREVWTLHHQCGHSGGPPNNGPFECDVHGSVTDDHDDAIEGATVELEGTDWDATTDADGAYRIEDVDAGDYTITASADGHESQSEELAVSDDDVEVDFTLAADDDADNGDEPEPDTYTISGTVTDAATDEAIAGADVTLHEGENGDAVDDDETGNDGGFTFADVEKGDYTVTADADGYESNSTAVEVSDADVLDVEIELTATDDDDNGDDEQDPDVATVPWGVDRIGALDVHDEHTGAGVSIFIIDSGIEVDHPDLEDNIADDGHFAAETCTESSGPGGGPFASPDVECHEDWDDDNGHGTHVAGTAAATSTDEVLGVAPAATLHAVKVLDDGGSGTTSGVIAGVDHVAGEAEEADAPVVANMSLGGGGSKDGVCDEEGYHDGNDSYYEAICEATNEGVVFAVAAGNSGEDADDTVPAAYSDAVMTISATSCELDGNDEDQDCQEGTDGWASFSNYGDAVTIGAPGVDILSTWVNAEYHVGSGTSMASPHAAGAAALLLGTGEIGAEGYEAFAAIQGLLVDNAEDTDSWQENDNHDEGFLNVPAALEAVTGGD